MNDEDAAVQDARLGMTEEQWAWFQQYTRGYGDQDEHGIDLSLLRQNLRPTPTKRLRKHRRALALVLEGQRAAESAGLRRPDRRP